MDEEKQIIVSSQLEIAVRDALVRYIQERNVSDIGALKQYAKARYGANVHDFAVVELIALANDERTHKTAEPAPPARSIVRRR